MGETSDDEDSGGGSQSGASIKPGVDLVYYLNNDMKHFMKKLILN